MQEESFFNKIIDKIDSVKDSFVKLFENNEKKKVTLICPKKKENQKISLINPKVNVFKHLRKNSLKTFNTLITSPKISFRKKQKIKLHSPEIKNNIKTEKKIISRNLLLKENEVKNNLLNKKNIIKEDKIEEIKEKDNNNTFEKKEENLIEKKIKEEETNFIEEKTEEKKSKSGLNLNKNIKDDELLLTEDSELICDYEKGKIKFTRNGLCDFFNSLEKKENYKIIWEKENLKIELNDEGTILTKDFLLVKITYKQKKKELGLNALIENQIQLLYNPNYRKEWDEMYKNMEIYEGNNINYIVLSHAKSPCFLMSERYAIEKRFVIKINNNETLIFSTSVPNDFHILNVDAIRTISYCNLVKITQDEHFFYYTSLNQNDYKMTIPQFLINFTLPLSTQNWYNNLQKFSFNYKIVGNEVVKLSDEEIKMLN